MMTWKIRYTDKARRDLRNIMEYVSYDLLEPETASHPAAFSHTLVQGSHFVGHYGKIVSNRMGVFFNAQIFKRSKT